MTKKRDLKRRVRERAARTGESYVTARRQVMAGKRTEAGDDEPTAEPTLGGEARNPGQVVDELRPLRVQAEAEPAAGKLSIVELVDATADALKVGIKCTVRVWPTLLAHVDMMTALTRLRDVLVATTDDPAMATFIAVALRGEPRREASRWARDFETVRRFLRRTRAGLGGVSEDGHMLAIPIARPDGLVTMVCTLQRDGLSMMDSSDAEDPFVAALLPRTLFVVFAGRRRAVDGDLVIGRASSCHIQIRDGRVSRRHAAVVRRGGAFYIKDLGSTNGIDYRGMRIDNKRIEEGDVFHIDSYELRFTFQADD